MNTYLRQISWKVALALALVCLIRPLLSIAGVSETIKPVGPIVVTVMIAFIWIGVALKMKLKNPVATLALAGGFYGVFAALLPVLVSLTFPEKDPEMLPLPGVIAVVVMNVLWGAVLGLIAVLFRRFARS